jgi:hypothetical protein
LTQPSNGLFAPTRDWAALKHAYETHAGDLEEVATSNAISLKTLQAYARARKWERLSEPAAQPSKPIRPTPARRPASRKLAKPGAKATRKTVTKSKREKAPALNRPAVPAAVDTIAITSITRAEIIGRLYAAIFRKVEQLEICMSTNEPVATADHERETRIIGTLLRNVELVDDVTRPASGSKPNADVPKSVGASPDRGIDAEHLRRELAARVKRLRERQPG